MGGLSNINVVKQLSQGPTHVIFVYSVLAAVSLLIFGLLHILANRSPHVGYLELVGVVIFLLNMALLARTHRVVLARNIYLLTVLLFLVLMLITGGTENTGIYWLFVFPLIAFFLGGKRFGLLWTSAFFVVMLAVWVLAIGGVLTLPYDNVTIRQALFAVLMVSIGIDAYEHSRQSLADQSVASREALRHEKIQAEVIVQYINEGIVATDAAGNVTFMNQAAEKLLGWQASDLLGKKIVEMVPMLDVAGRPLASDNRLTSGHEGHETPLATVATYRHKDGEVIPLSVTTRPVVVDGKVVGVVGTYRDISEEQSVVHAKSEFVTLASHQLRTPISAISWLSELLLSGDVGTLSAEQREHVESIHYSNQRLAELVSEMLIVSSLDLGSLTVKPQKIDIAKAVAAVINDHRKAFDSKKIAVVENYDQNIGRVPCDTDMIKLIMRHLISNALKYTPKGGEVKVEIKKTDEKILSTSKGSVAITVADNGAGIPSDSTDRVFAKFFRGKNILHTDTDGTGLGLYIVKSALDYVGGRVTFSSREGEGTKFTILLPLEGMIKHEPSKPTGEKNA